MDYGEKTGVQLKAALMSVIAWTKRTHGPLFLFLQYSFIFTERLMKKRKKERDREI